MVGGVGIDHVVAVPAWPLPVVDSLLVPPIRSVVAHTGNGVARGLRALGRAVALVDVIGDDVEGHMIRHAYDSAGIEVTFHSHPSGTRRAVNLVGPTGERMSLYDPRHPDGFVPDPALWRDRIPHARHVHVSIMDWCRHALADAVAAGRSTSTDLHDWDGESEHHRDFAHLADLVFVSAAALRAETRVVESVFTHGRAGLVVVTDGARGSRVYRRGGAVVAVPAVSIPGRPAIDSNGAGDSYAAGFLHIHLAGGDAGAAAAAGAVAGAYACGTAGTHTSFVDAATLAALVAESEHLSADR